jgi:hypothetical protein
VNAERVHLAGDARGAAAPYVAVGNELHELEPLALPLHGAPAAGPPLGGQGGLPLAVGGLEVLPLGVVGRHLHAVERVDGVPAAGVILQPLALAHATIERVKLRPGDLANAPHERQLVTLEHPFSAG